jgi:Zn-dependent metalloprotease
LAEQHPPQQTAKQTVPDQPANASSILASGDTPAHSVAAVQQDSRGKAAGDTRYANRKKIAASYLEQIVGAEAAKSFQVNDELSHGDADFGSVVFTRMINGVPYLGETYRIGIDKSGGLSGVSINTNKDVTLPTEKFPDPAKAISQAEAEKIFAAHLRLVYVERQALKRSPISGQPVESGPVMQYIAEESYIDAVTGKLLNAAGKLSPPTVIPVSGKAEKLVARSREEAAKLLADQFQLDIHAESIRVEAQNLEGEKRYVWAGGSLTVSEKTGQVISLQLNQTASPSRGAMLSAQEAEEAALQFLQKYLNPAVQELIRVEMKEEKGAMLYFRFVMSHKSIPVIDHAYEVTVDRNSGKVVSFSGDFDREPVALPDKEKAVSADTAAAEYLKQYPLTLAYVWPTENGQKTDAPYLVYTQLKQKSAYLYLDAASGRFVDVLKK